MKVILLKDVPKLGRKGAVMEVSEGHANNFLVPRGFAKIATAEIQQKAAVEAQGEAARQEKQAAQLRQLKTYLEKHTFSLKVKVGDKGQVFGGIHGKDIAAAINSQAGGNIEKTQVEGLHGIKTLGEHEITVKLGHGIAAKTKLNIEAL
jgi:large subunit ribosomal protein L9